MGGSGAYDFPEGSLGTPLEKAVMKTPFGDSSPIILYEKGGFHYFFISRHGEKGYEISAPFVNYRANIYGAKLLGVERIISWSGPGIINTNFSPGSLMIPDDLIDFTKGRRQTFFEGKGIGFVRQNPLFCPVMKKELVEAAERAGPPTVRGGTYVCTEGPRLETAAEIRMFGKWGGDVVGMTVAPEVFLAREMEICYHPLCYLTNYAEGVHDLPYQKGVLFEGTLPSEREDAVEEAKRSLPEICIEVLTGVNGEERNCPCSVSMERYRKGQMKGNNLTEWVSGAGNED